MVRLNLLIFYLVLIFAIGSIADSDFDSDSAGAIQILNQNSSTGQLISSYLGCFEDRSTRDLNGNVTYSSAMNLSLCLSLCRSQQFSYAGLQNRYYCFCGNYYGLYSKLDESKCNCTCSGDRYSSCGCSGTNKVYSTGIVYKPIDSFIGCYKDNYPRDLTGISFSAANMTIKYCKDYCSSQGYKYYGLQYSYQCFCGVIYGTYGIAASNRSCACPCYGLKYSECGCGLTNRVFSTQYVEPVLPNYKGCYQDQSIRDLNGDWFYDSKMTREMCISSCTAKNFSYAGLQDRGWCFCGNNYGLYGKLDESKCNCPCNGMKGLGCGCSSTNRVYGTGIVHDPPQNYLGCYLDQGTRDLTRDVTSSPNMTLEMCLDYCGSKGYRYIGLQYYSYCFCDNRYGTYRRLPERNCSCPCKGNNATECGCGWTNRVFSTGVVAPKYDNYRGCYKDAGNRDLNGDYFSSPNMTIELCTNYCGSKGFLYAGLQYRYQCFCGSTYGKYGPTNETNCACPCNGRKSADCGCAWTQGIYRTSDVCTPNPCGMGANCRNILGKAICSCPADKSGDPRVRCCKPISCGCWGDPHCHTFDKGTYDHMGRCTYDYISTSCANSVLPPGLFPFVLRQKQEYRAGVPNEKKVSFINSILLDYNNTSYVILKKNGTQHRITVNGTLVYPPFSNADLTAFVDTSDLVFSTSFGLTVRFDGNHRAEYLLCDAYSNFVCGMCGDGDGNPNNDFVDRNDKLVDLSGNRFSKIFSWAYNWRSRLEDGIDIDGSSCLLKNSSGPPQTLPGCANPSIYNNLNWCGIVTNSSGPWSSCLSKLDSSAIDAHLRGCSFDLCALESNKTLQNDYKCNALLDFTTKCLALGQSLGLNWVINWRAVAKCPMACPANSVFDVRAECPKTCLSPDGNYDCGLKARTEGCFCNSGYVRVSNGSCIKLQDCGCKLPDNSSSIGIGKTIISLDCSKVYSCSTPQGQATVQNFPACSKNAYCNNTDISNPNCVCKSGFTGNGYNCTQIPREDDIKNYIYEGCFKDKSSDKDLKGATITLSNMTIGYCIRRCQNLGFKFAGLENGNQCNCGSSRGRFGQLEESKCNCSCYGDKSTSCGCNSAQRIYQTNDPCYGFRCGVGALCQNASGIAKCYCPAGKSGNPSVRCCGSVPLSCGCYGDPHCHTFDKSNFNFMGRCTYDYVSTNCTNSTLPPELDAFTITQTQEKRAGRNENRVSYINSFNLYYKGVVYKFVKKNGTFSFFVNAATRRPPFVDSNNVTVSSEGGKLVVSTSFGLKIYWNGKDRVEYLLCDAYANYVCGLCGNADGNQTNDFVDRNNTLFDMRVNKFQKVFKWGLRWKSLYQDNSIDIDNTRCQVPPPPIDNSTIPTPICVNDTVYLNQSWCGLINNPLGPWAQCIATFDPSDLEEYLESCQFDLCALEGNESMQLSFKCKAFEELSAKCISLNSSWIINWRNATNCPKTCDSNMVFDVRAECSKTCLNPDGNYDCGALRLTEGCYCVDGFVLDSNGVCIKKEDCGCRLPDNSTTIKVGERLPSLDCSVVYSCNASQSDPIIEDLGKCDSNASCNNTDPSNPICVCNQGYSGNGSYCEPVVPPVIIDPCEESDNQTCYIFGDPHYFTIYGYKFTLKNDCSYMLASDSCNASLSSYQIFADQEHINGSAASFIASLLLKINDDIYYFDSRGVQFNGYFIDFPYSSVENGLTIDHPDRYYNVQSDKFYFKYDGDLVFKFSSCTNTFCGLCGLKQGDDINQFASGDSSKIYCPIN